MAMRLRVGFVSLHDSVLLNFERLVVSDSLVAQLRTDAKTEFCSSETCLLSSWVLKMTLMMVTAMEVSERNSCLGGCTFIFCSICAQNNINAKHLSHLHMHAVKYIGAHLHSPRQVRDK